MLQARWYAHLGKEGTMVPILLVALCGLLNTVNVSAVLLSPTSINERRELFVGLAGNTQVPEDIYAKTVVIVDQAHIPKKYRMVHAKILKC